MLFKKNSVVLIHGVSPPDIRFVVTENKYLFWRSALGLAK